MLEARELVTRLCHLGVDNMNKQVYLMTEDGENFVPFTIFHHEGKIILKPYDKKHGIKIV
jgi:hypothetical protein